LAALIASAQRIGLPALNRKTSRADRELTAN
jgi:hypothetical protein